MTQPDYKVKALLQIVRHLDNQATRKSESAELTSGAIDIALSIEDQYIRSATLRKIAEILSETQQWDKVQTVISAIKDSDQRALALTKLGSALDQAQRLEQALAVWSEAEKAARSIKKYPLIDSVLSRLGRALAQAQQLEQAETVIRSLSGDARALAYSGPLCQDKEIGSTKSYFPPFSMLVVRSLPG